MLMLLMLLMLMLMLMLLSGVPCSQACLSWRRRQHH
jgi:hypothetical protein